LLQGVGNEFAVDEFRAHESGVRLPAVARWRGEDDASAAPIKKPALAGSNGTDKWWAARDSNPEPTD
jgi:hypothetical protein